VMMVRTNLNHHCESRDGLAHQASIILQGLGPKSHYCPFHANNADFGHEIGTIIIHMTSYILRHHQFNTYS
jgi:hypothetical protein